MKDYKFIQEVVSFFVIIVEIKGTFDWFLQLSVETGTYKVLESYIERVGNEFTKLSIVIFSFKNESKFLPVDKSE